VEEANLFNPAFCTVLLAKAVEDFSKKTKRAFPYPLLFLVLPIVLHPRTRSALPHSTITSLLAWAQDNHEQMVSFASHLIALRDVTREALLFGLQHKILSITDDGDMVIGPNRQTPTERRTELFTEDARQCVDRAAFLGRWFAAAGTTATIYAAWGVAP